MLFKRKPVDLQTIVKALQLIEDVTYYDYGHSFSLTSGRDKVLYHKGMWLVIDEEGKQKFLTNDDFNRLYEPIICEINGSGNKFKKRSK